MSDAQTGPAVRSARGEGDDGPSAPLDLHLDVHQLMARLLPAVDDGRWLDAYLLCCGIVQTAEDRLQGAAWWPRRLLEHLDAPGTGRSARTVLRSARRGLDGATSAFLRSPGIRDARSWGELMALLGDSLADLATGGPVPTGLGPELRRAAGLLARPEVDRLLGREIVRPPSCFRSFDQHPADVVALVRRFVGRQPASDGRPVLVLGIRTSGSYLAPLAGAALRRLGRRRVVVGTTRPGAALLPARDALVRDIRDGGGTVLVLDDPPVTGASLARVAARAEQEGFPTASVVPMFATFEDDGAVPPPLRPYPCVVLPGTDWQVRESLRAPALAAMLPGLGGIEAGEQGPLSRWSHLSVRVTATDRESGETVPLVAEWTGVGWLGRQAVATAAALDGLVPRVRAFADGVLVREYLPGEDGTEPGRVGAAEVARYVAARQQRLAVPADRSLLLAGRQPVWEVAARILAPAFGRAGLALRPPLLDPLTRSLLTADHPCVTDGRTARRYWVADGTGGRRKTAFAEGAFSNLDLASYDAAYDLAGAVEYDIADDDELVDAYQHLTGHRIPAARWCVLRLVQAWNTARLAPAHEPPSLADPQAPARRAQARAVQRFLSDVYLADLPTEPRGPWCVLDIDGVLETDVLGFPASSPQGMLALRALRAHGYRSLVATGRSLPEVRDRCAAYRLTGGVAEYGAAWFDARAYTSGVRLPGGRAAGDGGLRLRLSRLPSVCVDPFSRWCVRASVQDGTRRTGLPAGTVAALLADERVSALFTALPGDAQTDFVRRGISKADGVRGLLEHLGEGAARPLLEHLGEGAARPLLAVGDGIADLPLLEWAEYGVAPANAGSAVRSAGIPVVRRPYQAGLAAAVGGIIGHRPGDCPTCRLPRQPADTRALLALLAVPESGRAAAPGRIALLARAVLRQRASARGTPPPGRSRDAGREPP